MSEMSEFTPSQFLKESRERQEAVDRLAELGEVERSVATLFVANAAILEHFYEPDPVRRESAMPAALTCALALTLLSACASERAVVSQESVPTSTSQTTSARTVERATEAVLSTSIPRVESSTATPVVRETVEPTAVKEEVPEWAKGLSFGDLRFVAENGGIAEEVKATFVTPDGVAIEIAAKPRTLADIRKTEGVVDPYNYRRPDNAVLQNWVRETGRTVPVQTVHSASGDAGPLSGEGARKWLEEKGGLFGGARTSEEMLAQAESLVGTEVEFTQGGVTERGRIAMVLRADTNELEEHMRVLHPDQDKYPNQFATYDYLDFFGKSDFWKENPDSDVVMYMFCGRDGSDEVNNGRGRLETHRWLVVIVRES